ncbi:hypothetical protein ACA910_018503 [Epithemia clementina (nom. ined.)]
MESYRASVPSPIRQEQRNSTPCERVESEVIAVFENHHFVVQDASVFAVLRHVSTITGWPQHFLTIQCQHDNYVVVRTQSRILGGKGGFGSLLKSQSRQAGAHATTNFGACRDLQGRRLRHVNDAVAAAQAREWREKIASGQAQEVDRAKAIIETDSRVPGWYLELPAWSDISKKEYRKWQRQFRRWKNEQEKEQMLKDEKLKQNEFRVQHYVETANQASETARASLKSALQEGLSKHKKKQPQQPQQEISSSKDRQDEGDSDSAENLPAKRSKQQPEPPTALLTLSGDVVLAFEDDRWHVQSQSNFCTFGIVLQSDRLKQMDQSMLYWEVKLVTGGLSQIGWAESSSQRFQPNSESGDGVGDDVASYAYDGSRSMSLHQSETKSYGSKWKEADVVGCLYNYKSGEISFSLNGNDLGVAFTVAPETILFPAASCNPKEILELHLENSDMLFLPTTSTAVPISRVIATENVRLENDEADDDDGNEDDDNKNSNDDDDGLANLAWKSYAGVVSLEVSSSKDENAATDQASATEGAASTTSIPNNTTPLTASELEQIQAVSELEALGLDRLKETLRSMGVKCGGTLQQRAERLFSLKGLQPQDYPKCLLSSMKP